MNHDRLNLPVRGSNLHGNGLCGNSSMFLDRVCLIPRSFCFWGERVEVRFVLLVEVFAFAFAVVVVLDCFFFDCVPVVVSDRWFFFSAVCVLDFGEDDFTLGDTPREIVSFFPVERLEDVVGDFDEEVLRVVILLDFGCEFHLQ